MTGSGSLSFAGTLVGFPSGQRTILVTYPIPSALDDAFPVTLGLGNTQVNVPANANGVIIEPPPGNAIVISIKSSSGDTGLAIHRTLGLIYFMDISQTSFFLSVPTALPGPVQLTFF